MPIGHLTPLVHVLVAKLECVQMMRVKEFLLKRSVVRLTSHHQISASAQAESATTCPLLVPEFQSGS